MNKQLVTGWIIQESVSDPTPIKNLKVIDQPGLFSIQYDTILQTFNIKNRNNRIYPGKVMIPSLNSDHILELEKKGSWCGEGGHPSTNEVQRLLTIDPLKISHKILSHTVDNNMCRGRIETLCNEIGINKARLILQGLEPAYSLRALAPLRTQQDGTNIVTGKAHVVTYDWVILPSHKEAYRDESKPITKICKSIEDSGNSVKESAIQVEESAIIDFIRMESVSVNTISNICEIASSHMSVSKDFKYAILKEANSTYIVDIEDHIHNEITSYMSKL
jgi:hypothetical protein